jgi:broad specificity phosphatase PhoE
MTRDLRFIVTIRFFFPERPEPSMSLTLYLLRHGETASSASGGFCGAIDPDLTAEGHEMAQDFGSVYAGHPFKAAYVSPMLRARNTATPVCAAQGIEMNLRPGLSEVSFGEWEGKTTEEVRQLYPKEYLRWSSDAGWNGPPGGERGIDVARRALLVLDEIQANHDEGDILVVSHKATIRILICALLGIDIGGYRDRIGISVCSLSVVQFNEHGPRLDRLGDRSHLRPTLRARVGT